MLIALSLVLPLSFALKSAQNLRELEKSILVSSNFMFMRMTDFQETSSFFAKKNKIFFVIKLARGGQPLACQKKAPPRNTKTSTGQINPLEN